jgi:hypothetical protein
MITDKQGLEEVKAAKERYPDAWKSAHVEGDEAREDFIHLLAEDMHHVYPEVALNGKRGNPNDLSDDALNILDESGPGRTPEGQRCWVVDVIAGAGGTNPQPAWQKIQDAVGSSGAHVLPGPSPQPPTPIPPNEPTYPPYPGDEVWDAMGVVLFADYERANKLRPDDPNTKPNPGMSRWFGRVEYDWLVKNVPTLQAAIDKQRPNWCAALGIPVE